MKKAMFGVVWQILVPSSRPPPERLFILGKWITTASLGVKMFFDRCILVFGTQGLPFYLIGVLARFWRLFAAPGQALLWWHSTSQEMLGSPTPYADKCTTPVISPVSLIELADY